MLSYDSFATATAILAFTSIVAAAPSKVPEKLSLTAQLQLADTAVDRYHLLPKDEDFIFDFNKSSVPMANRKTFPALVGSGLTMALGTVPACGMASLHIHPRAAEAFAVVSGRIIAESVPEAGVVDAKGNPRAIRADLGPNQMTIFHAGTFHVQMNPECKPATVIAAFASEDPGINLIAPSLFALDDKTLTETFGKSIMGEDIDRVRKAIPKGVAFLVDQCLAQCGLKKRQV